MIDYRIWGTVNQIGPKEFAVIVTAVCVESPGAGTYVRQAMCATRDEAIVRQYLLAAELVEEAVRRGDKIVDVEYAE